MATVVEATYERGVFRPHAAVPVPEGQVVDVLIPDPGALPSDEALRDLLSLAGLVNSGDPDAVTEDGIARALAAEHAGSHEGM